MKEKILNTLKTQKGFVSGQTLCNEFGVSRTAVWKAINALKDKGYNIESVTNKGYRLVSAPDILKENEFKDNLKTLVIGKSVTVLETVDSTNNYLKKNQKAFENGAVVVAREQTGGKGRLGRVWHSQKDDTVSFSIILRPDISPMEVSAVTPLCGLALCKALNSYFDFDAKIKWPNDIIVGNKKLCGVLTEMGCEFDKVDYIVIGIGINLLNEDFPEEIAYKATSCKKESSKEIDKNLLLANILKEIEDTLIQSDFRFTEQTLREYKENCATINRSITFTRKGEQVSATATDINSEGELIATLPNGETEVVFSGEVTVQGIY